MGLDNRVVETRGGPLSADGVVVRGVQNIQAPGRVSQARDVTDILSQEREFVTDIPDPGNLTFTLLYNPADPEHQDLEQKFLQGQQITWEWLIQAPNTPLSLIHI